MDYNAKQNKRDIYGNTPLIYACLNGQYETSALLLQVRRITENNVQNRIFVCDICVYVVLGISISLSISPSKLLRKKWRVFVLALLSTLSIHIFWLDKYYFAIVQLIVFMELLCGRWQVFLLRILLHRVFCIVWFFFLSLLNLEYILYTCKKRNEFIHEIVAVRE